MKKTLLALCIGAAASNVAVADGHGHGNGSDFEAYLGGSYYLWDSDRNLENEAGFDVGAELPLDEAFSLEAWLSQVDTDFENTSVEAEAERYSLGGLYHLNDGDLRPFLSLGASHQEVEVNGSDNDETLAYLGAGVKKYFDNNLILRGEVLGMNSLDNELTDAAVRIALGYAFGRSADTGMAEKITAAVAPAPAPKKEEPAPMAEEKPMPAEPVAVAAPVEPPKDTDGDGVFDKDDLCAGTDTRFKVDATGCPVMLTEPVSIKLNVRFATNSAEITPDSRPEIKEVADFMAQFDKTTVKVEGHTDDRGRAAYNKQLSQKRADAVRQELINTYGVAAERVTAVGLGEAVPLESNDTAEGRAANRRVVAVVEGEEQVPAVK